MRVFAISDLHLAPRYGAPAPAGTNPAWRDHPRALIEAWQRVVSEADVVLMPGDVAEAPGPALEAAISLLDRLPGHKVITPGNHDPAILFSGAGGERLGRRRTITPLSGEAVKRISWGDQRSALVIGALGGDHGRGASPTRHPGPPEELEASIKAAQAMREAHREPIILQLHHPPFTLSHGRPEPTPTSDLIEREGIPLVLMGHLHHPRQWIAAGSVTRHETRYRLVTGDFLRWRPLEITPLLDAALSGHNGP